ncbi:ent-kaur-16-ene synthase, chloroplastic-like [Mercurialis annua]|uniref:ent-kaur-16-ene synthase, chloroplastic-like n=1 Tax=Mercurialis annua TaxID=3986 RepID=UPI0024AD057A|nr:ent-kaur-16-ene synthase, chloroplastic-like [Mercurialis annua]
MLANLRRIILSTTIYFIWRARNKKVFANETISIEDIISRIKAVINAKFSNIKMSSTIYNVVLNISGLLFLAAVFFICWAWPLVVFFIAVSSLLRPSIYTALFSAPQSTQLSSPPLNLHNSLLRPSKMRCSSPPIVCENYSRRLDNSPTIYWFNSEKSLSFLATKEILLMSLLTRNIFTFACERKTSSSLKTSYKFARCERIDTGSSDEGEKSKGRRIELLEKAKLSISAYDTAWVAMVPCKESKEKPLFPKCLEWIMENQEADGSWSPYPHHPLLFKDYLSSTLACVITLHKWNLGRPLIKKGLKFIKANCWAAIEERQLPPIGFDFTFPHMIECAVANGLDLPVHHEVFDVLLQKRAIEIKRCELEGTKAHLIYILEGHENKYNWEEISKYQRNNGSFCNSPSATAAALFYNHDERCYGYLTSLLHDYDNAVPTVYPLKIYNQLCGVENLQKLGMDDRHKAHIDNVLDNIYGLWKQKDEEIYLDVRCCALGFRLLRLNGYDVSSDVLAQFSEEEHFFNSVSLQFKSIDTILELFKASKLMICENEHILEKIEAWTGSFLKQQLLSCAIKDFKLREEVDHALRYHFDNLDFVEMRWEIQQHKANNVQLLKTSYSLNNDNRDLLAQKIQEYNMCQAVYQKEYKDLERWIKICKFDELKFARVKLHFSYFLNTATLIGPELADARLSFTKNCILATVIDDFFDIAGSKEELENLVQLIESWGETSSIGCISEQVMIIFSALVDMIKELDCIAFKHHGRSIEHHMVKIWQELVKSMMKEAEWTRENIKPSLNEYMEHGCISLALGPLCHITTYFLGITLPEEIMAGQQICNLLKHVNLVGRLLNDMMSFKREREQGKYNSVSLRILHSEESMTEEEAIEAIKKEIEIYRKQLLRMVVQKENSLLPKSLRDYFWKTSKMMHYVYKDNDGYSNIKNEMENDAKKLLWEPISLS